MATAKDLAELSRAMVTATREMDRLFRKWERAEAKKVAKPLLGAAGSCRTVEKGRSR